MGRRLKDSDAKHQDPGGTDQIPDGTHQDPGHRYDYFPLQDFPEEKNIF